MAEFGFNNPAEERVCVCGRPRGMLQQAFVELGIPAFFPRLAQAVGVNNDPVARFEDQAPVVVSGIREDPQRQCRRGLDPERRTVGPDQQRLAMSGALQGTGPGDCGLKPENSTSHFP